MAYTVRFKPSAFETLSGPPKADQRRVFKHIESLGQNPHPPGSAKLKGAKGLLRLRSGRHRVIYRIQAKTVWILKVGDRKDVYRALGRLEKRSSQNVNKRAK